MGQSGSARFSFNRSGPGLQPDTTARTSPQRTVKGSRPDLQHEMRPTVFGALLIRTDAYQGLYKVELTTLYRPYFLPEFLPGLEEWHLLGRDLDRIAGFGIAPFSGIAASGTKTAKTSQLDFVALPQSLGNTREQNADDGFGLSLGKVDFVGNSSSEFCFCHVSSPTEGTRPTWTRTPTICDDRDGCPRTCSGMSRLWGGTTLNA